MLSLVSVGSVKRIVCQFRNFGTWSVSTILYRYVVQSKSNATTKIKWKLFLLHKNVFSQNFSPIYYRSERTFQWAPTTAGSRRWTGLRSQKAWPHPRSSSSPPGSAWWYTADSFLWVPGNRLLGTNQAKKWAFGKPSSRRRPTKCALRRRRAHQIWSFFANFFTRPRTSCRMLKFALAEPVGHVQDPSHWPGILFFSEAATAAVRSWSLLVFFKFQVGLIYSALAYQIFLKLLYILNKWKRLDPKSTFSH